MNESFLNYHSKLHSFHLFSIQHLITIGIIVGVCTILFVFRNVFNDIGNRNLFRFLMVFLLLISDILQQIWFIQQKAWSLKTALPLQLSDLVVLLAIIMLMTKGELLFKFLYFSGLGSSIQAILTPDLGNYSFPHFQYIEFFILHGGVLVACLFILWAYHYKPTIHSLWASTFIINVYGAGVFFLDKKLKANYLYLFKKPSSGSLLDFLGPWPWYLLTMDLAMILIFYIIYSPIILRKKFND